MAELSVEELCRTAEQYFARLEHYNYQLAKPFADVNESPQLLVCFSHILQGLHLVPGLTILDFGAGSCWASRFLTQLRKQATIISVFRELVIVWRHGRL